MGALFFVVLIVIFYVVINIVSRGARTHKAAGNEKEPLYKRDVFQTQHAREKNNKKSYRAAQAKVQQTQEKASAAKEHMKEKYLNEDSLRNEGKPEDVFRAAGIEADDGMILASAKLTSYAAEKDNEKIEDLDLLGPVYDLMVMGPDTSISFERDFVAEGLELMNRYHQ